MTEPRPQQAEPAKTQGIIERLEGGLELGEEPAGFIAVIEGEEDTRPDD